MNTFINHTNFSNNYGSSLCGYVCGTAYISNEINEFSSCLFENNYLDAVSMPANCYGSGLYIDSSYVILNYSDFINNSVNATSRAGIIYGGAIYLTGSLCSISNCNFFTIVIILMQNIKMEEVQFIPFHHQFL